MTSLSVVGGVEGGGSHSSLTLFNASDMTALASVEGPPTNVFKHGQEKTAKTVHEMATAAMKKAGVSTETQVRTFVYMP
jgi:N-acetylglucosamine kinase-like BadF-type ATPase